jgi:hypothetical protein
MAASNFDFISVTDRPALLALTTPDWQEAARAALVELGYKVQHAAGHTDFIANFIQVPFQVVVIEEHFSPEGDTPSRSLSFLQSAPMNLRRHCVIVLVGDSFTSFDTMEAYQRGVQLVVNRSEMPLLAQFIQKAVGDNDLFLHPYREAQRRFAAGLAAP